MSSAEGGAAGVLSAAILAAVGAIAGLALEAGSGCLVDADFAVCNEVAGRLGVLLDPLVLGKVVVDVVVVPGLFFVFVGLAVVVEPDAPGMAETGAWVVAPEAGGGVGGPD